ncbi:Hypothetical protein NTJ_10047 [Nesidiocoris tenuis]|uniref:Uncharacterized protein n=1 Tax=Nesidiocoris tenuis TaxID=355587 RepID=A0ABN7AZ08_9HEMI|nr:Hypothetical protein NTJ_10047 [Nesidiocoris tenuis]
MMVVRWKDGMAILHTGLVCDVYVSAGAIMAALQRRPLMENVRLTNLFFPAESFSFSSTRRWFCSALFPRRSDREIFIAAVRLAAKQCWYSSMQRLLCTSAALVGGCKQNAAKIYTFL